MHLSVYLGTDRVQGHVLAPVRLVVEVEGGHLQYQEIIRGSGDQKVDTCLNSSACVSTELRSLKKPVV